MLLVVVLSLAGAGCPSRREGQAQRAEAALALLEGTARKSHNPSAAAQGAERARLQTEAAHGYEEVLRRYPEQSNLCARARYGLGSIRASQTNLDAAVKHFAEVGRRYPSEEWEVLQAWKSAADLLWDAGRRAEAKGFYQRLVDRFDTTNAPQVVRLAVSGSKKRLAE